MSDQAQPGQNVQAGHQPGLARAVVEVAGGISLLVLGGVASFVPVMPGWLFVIPGLVLLACWFRPVRSDPNAPERCEEPSTRCFGSLACW